MDIIYSFFRALDLLLLLVQVPRVSLLWPVFFFSTVWRIRTPFYRSSWNTSQTEGCSGQAIPHVHFDYFSCLRIFRLSSVPPHLLYYCCCVNILWPWEINYFDLIWFDLKYQTRVKNTNREWKIPNASEKYQTRVKNTKPKWKIPNASEKSKCE